MPIGKPWSRPRYLVAGRRTHLVLQVRRYANPARWNLPVKIAFKPPPPPPVVQLPGVLFKDQTNHSINPHHAPADQENQQGKVQTAFDRYIEHLVDDCYNDACTDVKTLHRQYRDRAETVLDLVVPYEERPTKDRRADCLVQAESDAVESSGTEGDGLVMIVHALGRHDGTLDKTCTCSGFVVNAHGPSGDVSTDGSQVIISCAHTLEELYRKASEVSDNTELRRSFSFAIASTGRLFWIDEVLSSMPKSDVLAFRATSTDSVYTGRLRTLPVSPFPVPAGNVVLTHLFGTPGVPSIQLSTSRLPASSKDVVDKESVEQPFQWPSKQAWRRWAVGTMLGYRSYTGIEVEAGIHSSLPHILTTVLPSPGSSGGPLVCADTGAVVGMISGRRMDNRVEGERGWGSSAEGIFEMFSLPGFKPSDKR